MTSLKSLTLGRLARSTGPLLVMGLVALAGCSQQYGSRPAGLSPTQAKACDERSDAAYRQQYRGEIYRNDSYATSTRDSPFATGSNSDTVGPAPVVKP